MTLVVDASVAAKWFIQEPGSEEAAELLGAREPLVAPDLLMAEICNLAATKLRRGEADQDHIVASVQGLPQFFDDFISSAVLARRALQIARTLAHPAYDCFYLSLADLMNCKVVTADERLLQRLVGTEWSATVVKLGADR
jgi:predicted nucleic acid-binding protein